RRGGTGVGCCPGPTPRRRGPVLLHLPGLPAVLAGAVRGGPDERVRVAAARPFARPVDRPGSGLAPLVAVPGHRLPVRDLRGDEPVPGASDGRAPEHARQAVPALAGGADVPAAGHAPQVLPARFRAAGPGGEPDLNGAPCERSCPGLAEGFPKTGRHIL